MMSQMSGDPVDRFLVELERELDDANQSYWDAGLEVVARRVWDARIEAIEKIRDVVIQVCDDRGV